MTPKLEHPKNPGRGPDNLQRDEVVREYFAKNPHAQAGVPHYVKQAAKYCVQANVMKYAQLQPVYVSIDRLKRKGLMPKHTPKYALQGKAGKKSAPRPKVAAKVVTAKSAPPPPALSERNALVIEAARTGLRVRLLVDGTIEVTP